MPFPIAPNDGDKYVSANGSTYEYASATNSWQQLTGDGATVITTEGDIIQGDANGDPERLAIGAEGLVPVSTSGKLVYGLPTGALLNIRQLTASDATFTWTPGTKSAKVIVTAGGGGGGGSSNSAKHGGAGGGGGGSRDIYITGIDDQVAVNVTIGAGGTGGSAGGQGVTGGTSSFGAFATVNGGAGGLSGYGHGGNGGGGGSGGQLLQGGGGGGGSESEATGGIGGCSFWGGGGRGLASTNSAGAAGTQWGGGGSGGTRETTVSNGGAVGRAGFCEILEFS